MESQARKFLASMTKWDDLYFRLAASDFNDDRWSAKNFGKQKLADVKTALKYLDKHDMAKYNIQSVATAKLGTMAAGMMVGKKSNVKTDDFLPFDIKSIKKEDGVTDASLIVLQKLMKQRIMDGRVIALLADEIKAFGGRNAGQ
jgi:hypothetical protein